MKRIDVWFLSFIGVVIVHQTLALPTGNTISYKHNNQNLYSGFNTNPPERTRRIHKHQRKSFTSDIVKWSSKSIKLTVTDRNKANAAASVRRKRRFAVISTGHLKHARSKEGEKREPFACSRAVSKQTLHLDPCGTNNTGNLDRKIAERTNEQTTHFTGTTSGGSVIKTTASITRSFATTPPPPIASCYNVNLTAIDTSPRVSATFHKEPVGAGTRRWLGDSDANGDGTGRVVTDRRNTVQKPALPVWCSLTTVPTPRKTTAGKTGKSGRRSATVVSPPPGGSCPPCPKKCCSNDDDVATALTYSPAAESGAASPFQKSPGSAASPDDDSTICPGCSKPVPPVHTLIRTKATRSVIRSRERSERTANRKSRTNTRRVVEVN